MMSIIFSPTLQRLLSNRFLLFLGSISYPIFLLHNTLLRTVLVWAVYQGIPSLRTPNVGENDAQSTEIVTNSFASLQALAFCLWLVLLILLCKVWRDRVDRSCLIFSQWVEHIMTDTEAFFKVSSIGHSFGVALHSLTSGSGKGWKDGQV